mgnify:FL=1
MTSESFFNKPKLFRHGDLLIREVSSIPESVIPLSTNIIAEGEKTGHNHELDGPHRVYEDINKDLFFEAKQDIELKHPEHNTIRIPKGKYAIVHEREHDPFNNIEIKVED